MFDYQVSFGDIVASDSVAVDDFDVEWVVKSLDGWGAVSPTTQSVQRTRAPGAWSGKGYAQSRHISISGVFIAPDAAAASLALDRLNDSVNISIFTLSVTEADRTRYVRVRRSDQILVSWMNKRSVSWTLGLVADDPRKLYDEQSDISYLPSSIGGLTFPFTIPFTIDASMINGQVSLANQGNEDGPVFIRIYGPVTGPSITHSSGKQLSFSSSLELSDGEYLDIDMDRHTVLANGQQSRANYIISRGWSKFNPGDNTWDFTADSYNASAVMIVYATAADK